MKIGGKKMGYSLLDTGATMVREGEEVNDDSLLYVTGQQKSKRKP